MNLFLTMRFVIFTMLYAVAVDAAWAQLPGENPKEIEGLTIIEHLDESLPMDLKFKNSDGRTVTMGSLFDDELPVILSMNYSDCPMLCQLQLSGLIDALEELDMSAGEHFHVVSVSIDPLETTTRAKETKQKYLRFYNRPGTADGWHFFVGNKKNIDTLANTTGFQFRYVPARKEYAHPAVMMICTPGGRISRYLYGIEFPKQTIRLSLVEASEGKIGTTMDRILLFCFHYDATSGQYGPVALNIMKVAGFVTVASLSLFLVPIWLRRSKTKDAVVSEDNRVADSVSSLSKTSS